eukprot:SAG31_NODE_18202_length_643_cov_2.729779_1_plen_143_part_00
MADVENQPQSEKQTSAPDGFQVADLVGNYLGEHKNSMNNRTQARLGVAIKGLTHHLLGTKEHYAAEKIQSALKKPMIHTDFDGSLNFGRLYYSNLVCFKKNSPDFYPVYRGDLKNVTEGKGGEHSGKFGDFLKRSIDRGRAQ